VGSSQLGETTLLPLLLPLLLHLLLVLLLVVLLLRLLLLLVLRLQLRRRRPPVLHSGSPQPQPLRVAHQDRLSQHRGGLGVVALHGLLRGSQHRLGARGVRVAEGLAVRQPARRRHLLLLLPARGARCRATIAASVGGALGHGGAPAHRLLLRVAEVLGSARGAREHQLLRPRVLLHLHLHRLRRVRARLPVCRRA
jgi:hypothetical protein